jgi:hypothetical protein
MGTGYSEFNWFWYPGMGPEPFSALPPSVLYLTLALKLFRREPAITGFD